MKIKKAIWLIVFLALILIIFRLSNILYKEKQTQVFYESLKAQKTEMQSLDPIYEVSDLDSKDQFIFTPNPNTHFLDINPDFVAWLNVEGTNIQYPVVRGTDNSHYLNHDFNNRSNRAGAIFMDYRNIGQFNDWHTVIYGHYMENGSMFHDLHLFKDLSELTENQHIILEGLYGKRHYMIFSVYLIDANDHVIDIDVPHQERLNFLESLKDKSLVPSSITFNDSLQLLTLATCTYEFEDARLILHAIEVQP